jgi:hypothetical protein
MDSTEEIQQESELEPQVQVALAEEDAPVKVERAAENDEITPEEGINHLKKQLEEERKARAEADQRAYHAQVQAQAAQKNAQDGDYNLIVSAIDKSKRDSDLLKNGYAEAMAAGDYRKAADFQEAIALNANKLTTLENGKVAMENRQRQPVQPVAPPASDRVEQLASIMTPRSANWLRSHPEFAQGAKHEAMVRAHSHAMGEGHIPDTDAYFHHVEMRLGLHNVADEQDVVSVAAQPTQRRTSAPSPAPSTRMASASSGKPNVVRLSSEQREMASMMGMTPEEYAKNMVSLKREGKLQ